VMLMHPPGAARPPARVALVNAAFAPVYGLAMLTLVIAIRRRWRLRQPPAAQPGHWLLAIIGSGYLSGVLFVRTLLWLWGRSDARPLIVPIMGVGGIVIGAVVWLLCALLVLAAIDELWAARPWRLAFQFLGCTLCTLLSIGCCASAPLNGPFAFIAPTAALLLTLITVLYAASDDLLKGERRDLLHWLGVGSLFAVVAHLVALIALLWPK